MRFTIETIEAAADRHEEVRDGYLAERGWKHSSDHPDSCWRWQKEIDGKLYVTGPADAVRLQTFLDEEAELR